MTQNFSGMTIALIGAGVSNTPLAEFFTKKGAIVTVRDRKAEDELGEERCRSIRSTGALLICGEEYLSDLTEELVIRSPGIRHDIPEFEAVKARGGRVITELGLFLEMNPAKVFAVTGSDGKSTTTTITSILLERGIMGTGKAYLGGNIGEPLLHRIDGMTENDRVAAEISSFQLMDADFKAESAVITNISPNHLNWHTGMDEYIDAKKIALRHAKRAVLNYGCEITREIGLSLDYPVTWFSRDPIDNVPEKDMRIFPEDGVITLFRHENAPEKILPLEDILLPGMHNAENYMAAIGATLGYVSYDDIRDVASTFGGVRHRLELVRSIGNVNFYNSSIDSSPTRTAAALSAIPNRDLYLICGGYDKNIPFEPLADAVIGCGNVKTLVLTGATADKIKDAMIAHPGFTSSGIELLCEPDFTSAVMRASSSAMDSTGCRCKAVLLSPACASFDAFANFEERGYRFCEIVRNI
ncbi:MAG: UDP-N-acetylmuramoyl-L-alanine--D-glutamate ligase [Ruminococcaceae bacterium]|nr:UDP-N-acetylmuramoyl-L-alanine--D-glutamate ligase [Oscillospiraceae bacterium]